MKPYKDLPFYSQKERQGRPLGKKVERRQVTYQETGEEMQETEEGDRKGNERTKEGYQEVKLEVKETGKPVRQTETVVFILSTPGSRLKEILQSQDNLITSSMSTPQVRFVERSGTTLMEDLGKNNPWAAE